jgi:alpha,alpha-trehalase
MLANYIAASNDTAILDRALPLAEARSYPLSLLSTFDTMSQQELAWWSNNRSLSVTSPYTNETYTLSRYAVTNSAPRPESYLTGISYIPTFDAHSQTS